MEGASNAISSFIKRAISFRTADNRRPVASSHRASPFQHSERRKGDHHLEDGNQMPKSRQKLPSGSRRLMNKLRRREATLLNLVDEISKSGCHPQLQSPLFKLPGEIREHIFSYVLSESDGRESISQHDYWYRPDYPSHRYIDTALLRTCRQVWVETYALPRRNVSPRIWLGSSDRESPRRFAYAEGVNEEILFPTMESDHLRRNIHANESLQVFAQMYMLELDRLNEAVSNASVKASPRRITITLRYTDWWNWEMNSPLRIEDTWAEKFEAPNSVEEVVLELETRNGKKPELDALISRQVSKWVFRTEDRKALVLHGQPKESFWVGSAKPGGVTFPHHTAYANQSGPMGQDEMLYYTVKLKWKRES
ncbi:hypothetical protein FKW77_002903 [Venturia effusa]|uniref:F-box domain-containing protein n=1 Tax=Venturia effusa TaxID=50376 RepID=A0A517LMN1_9PEZI|nr:hypothetical protein FKW77_002903 [Venturia effusa]